MVKTLDLIKLRSVSVLGLSISVCVNDGLSNSIMYSLVIVRYF